MERVVHKAIGFDEAREWEIRQHLEMSVDERQRAARELKLRVYGPDAPDVRQAERERQR